MPDFPVIGQIVAVGAVSPYGEGGGERGNVPTRHAGLAKGQVLQAKVAADASGNLLLELGGSRYLASGGIRLVPGQTITVRVSELLPQLELEVLAERTPEEQRLAASLRTLFAGGGDVASLSRELLGEVERLRGLPERPLPQELLQRIAQRLAPVEVGSDAAKLSGDLKQVLARAGLDFEAGLRAVVEGRAEAGGGSVADSEGLKQLLARLLLALGRQPLAAPEPPAAQAGGGAAALLEGVRGAWEALRARWSPLSAGEGGARVETAELGARVEAEFEAALRAAESGRAEQRLRAALAVLREEFTRVSRRVPATSGNRAAFLRDVEELLREVERRFVVETFLRGAGRELARSASELRERIEALQVLNSHLGERELHQHLLFPVSLLGELTEVQVKQFIAGGDKKGRRNLTAVILLELESIGRVRIDALLQGRSLYVNLFVEQPEVARLADELYPEFAERLEARGFTLARFNSSVDAGRIDSFHHLDAEILGGEEGLIDLQV